MNKYLFLLLLIGYLFVSCKETDENNESVLFIKGISSYDEFGYQMTEDDDDWRLNEKLSNKEKQLFDTLNFAKVGIAEQITDTINLYFNTPRIEFFPNPIRAAVRVAYYNKKHILNLEIVDKKYTKLHSFRLKDNNFYFLLLNNLKNATIYRVYYVIQDSNYNIVHTGHGDIMNE